MLSGAARPNTSDLLKLPNDEKANCLQNTPSIFFCRQNMSVIQSRHILADGHGGRLTALRASRALFGDRAQFRVSPTKAVPSTSSRSPRLVCSMYLRAAVRKPSVARITGQLNRASSGAHLWAEKFRMARWNIRVRLQDAVTRTVVVASEPA